MQDATCIQWSVTCLPFVNLQNFLLCPAVDVPRLYPTNPEWSQDTVYGRVVYGEGNHECSERCLKLEWELDGRSMIRYEMDQNKVFGANTL